jgi:DNA-binding MarR family transcriptional regulator
MASIRLSQLQQQILRWLVADHQRTRGLIASSHQELVRALHKDKGNLSHSLHTLATHGLLVIGRSPGGHAESVILTAAGHQRAAQLPGSCD